MRKAFRAGVNELTNLAERDCTHALVCSCVSTERIREVDVAADLVWTSDDSYASSIAIPANWGDAVHHERPRHLSMPSL